MVDGRTNLSRTVVDSLQRNYGSVIKMYRSTIPVAVKAAESAAEGKSIYAYEPNSTVTLEQLLDDIEYCRFTGSGCTV